MLLLILDYGSGNVKSVYNALKLVIEKCKSSYDIKVSKDTFWVNTNIGVFAIKGSGELNRYLPLHSEEVNFTKTGNLIETNPYGGVRVYSDLDLLKYTHFEKDNAQTPTMVVGSLQRGDKTYFSSVFSGLYAWENNRFTSYRENGIWGEKKLKHITVLGNDLAISNEFGDVFIVNDDESFKIQKKIPKNSLRPPERILRSRDPQG